MRFKNYLNEGVPDKLIEQAQPFLKEFGGDYAEGNFIFRGIKGKGPNKGIKIKKVRKDRKPRLIHPILHKILGKYSEELFGWNFRSEGVFSGDFETADSYGNPFIFIPKGPYKYVWCDEDLQITIYQLYDEITNAINNTFESNASVNDIMNDEKISRKIKQLKKQYEKYKTKRLSDYINNHSFEAIFKCDEYFLINQDYWEDKNIKELL